MAISANCRESDAKTLAGDLLWRIEPADACSALELAEIAVEEAQAELVAATRDLDLAGRDRKAAETQARLQDRGLDRQKKRRAQGIGVGAG